MEMTRNTLEVSIDIMLRQPSMGGNGIRLNETTQIKVDSFMQACEVLADFHKLIEALNQK